jgi:hypothetical protein
MRGGSYPQAAHTSPLQAGVRLVDNFLDLKSFDKSHIDDGEVLLKNSAFFLQANFSNKYRGL